MSHPAIRGNHRPFNQRFNGALHVVLTLFNQPRNLQADQPFEQMVMGYYNPKASDISKRLSSRCGRDR